ncbi:MAG: DUF4407 domain-containing protein [Xanthobacteraceae bacterium]
MENPDVPPPPRNFSLPTKMLLWIPAGDLQILRNCAMRDLTNILAIAWLMLATMLYQTALFSLIGEQLFDSQGQLWPVIILASFGLAAFILLIDRYAVVLSGFHQEGVAEIARGGIDTSGGIFSRVKLGLFLIVRIGVLSVGLALLCGIFATLLIFGGTIRSHIEGQNLRDNASLITASTTIVDTGIKKVSDDIDVEMKHVESLSAQVTAIRQNKIDPTANDPQIQGVQQELQRLLDQRDRGEQEFQVDQASAADESGGIKSAPGISGRPGYGPRYRAAMEKAANAKSRVQEFEKRLSDARARLDALRTNVASTKDAVTQRSDEQLPSFEEALKAETAKLAGLKNDLANQIADRDHAIRKLVEEAPNHVSSDYGLLAQIAVLEEIAQKDSKIGLLILLLDIVSFGLELAAVLARVTGYAPTTYAALLASDVYMSAVRIAEDMATELDAIESRKPRVPEIHPQEAPLAPTAASFEPASDEYTPPPIKRGRGRPRKHPLPVPVKDANGRED